MASLAVPELLWGEKNWTRCCHFLPPLTMEGHANINPHSCPLFLALLLAIRGVLRSIWTTARQQGGWKGSLQATMGGVGCGISPITSFSCHVLELEMMGCSLRVCLTSLGSRGDLSPFHPLSPEKVCVKRARIRGRECESPSVLYYE